MSLQAAAAFSVFVDAARTRAAIDGRTLVYTVRLVQVTPEEMGEAVAPEPPSGRRGGRRGPVDLPAVPRSGRRDRDR